MVDLITSGHKRSPEEQQALAKTAAGWLPVRGGVGNKGKEDLSLRSSSRRGPA